MISPLLWHIIYDSLLTFIAAKGHLGFNFTEELSLGGLAYADDTGWMADSKANLQLIIDHASEFSTLLILNST